MATHSGLSDDQELALMGETQLALAFTVEGLRGLAWPALDAAYYRMPLLLVSQGLERLLKLAVCTAQLKRTGALPTWEEVRSRFLHNLIALLDAVTPLLDSYKIRRITTEEQELHLLLQVMSDLGSWARYYELDTLLGRPFKEELPVHNPMHGFNMLRHQLGKRRPDLWGEVLVGHPRRYVKYVNGETTAILQRFLTELCQLLLVVTPFEDTTPLRVFAELTDPYKLPSRVFSSPAVR
jgi:hypothetical protein